MRFVTCLLVLVVTSASQADLKAELTQLESFAAAAQSPNEQIRIEGIQGLAFLAKATHEREVQRQIIVFARAAFVRSAHQGDQGQRNPDLWFMGVTGAIHPTTQEIAQLQFDFFRDVLMTPSVPERAWERAVMEIKLFLQGETNDSSLKKHLKTLKLVWIAPEIPADLLPMDAESTGFAASRTYGGFRKQIAGPRLNLLARLMDVAYADPHLELLRIDFLGEALTWLDAANRQRVVTHLLRQMEGAGDFLIQEKLIGFSRFIASSSVNARVKRSWIDALEYLKPVNEKLVVQRAIAVSHFALGAGADSRYAVSLLASYLRKVPSAELQDFLYGMGSSQLGKSGNVEQTLSWLDGFIGMEIIDSASAAYRLSFLESAAKSEIPAVSSRALRALRESACGDGALAM